MQKYKVKVLSLLKCFNTKLDSMCWQHFPVGAAWFMYYFMYILIVQSRVVLEWLMGEEIKKKKFYYTNLCFSAIVVYFVC